MKFFSVWFQFQFNEISLVLNVRTHTHTLVVLMVSFSGKPGLAYASQTQIYPLVCIACVLKETLNTLMLLLLLVIVMAWSVGFIQLLGKISRDFLREGWLNKTGPNAGDAFRRRWFTLDNRRLAYFIDPLVCVAHTHIHLHILSYFTTLP